MPKSQNRRGMTGRSGIVDITPPRYRDTFSPDLHALHPVSFVQPFLLASSVGSQPNPPTYFQHICRTSAGPVERFSLTKKLIGNYLNSIASNAEESFSRRLAGCRHRRLSLHQGTSDHRSSAVIPAT